MFHCIAIAGIYQILALFPGILLCLETSSCLWSKSELLGLGRRLLAVKCWMKLLSWWMETYPVVPLAVCLAPYWIRPNTAGSPGGWGCDPRAETAFSPCASSRHIIFYSPHPLPHQPFLSDVCPLSGLLCGYLTSYLGPLLIKRSGSGVCHLLPR